jgi:L-alanine-DL-glutamate epimerase-like enolase superfamily enzyme
MAVNRRVFGLTVAAPAAALGAPEQIRKLGPIRITAIKTVEVRNVPTGKGLVLPWDPKKIPQDTRDYVIAQIFTDQGLVGTAMDGDYKLPAGIGETVRTRAEAYFIGKDVNDIQLHDQEFFHKVKAPVRLFFLDIALWDILGKAVGLPLYRLWGAHSNKVKPYAATVHFGKTAEERVEDALRFYEQGFRAIKLRLHKLTLEEDLELPRKVIGAVKGRMDVMVDANQAGKRVGDPPPVWDLERSKRTALELEQMGLYWLEEPLNRLDFAGLAATRGVLREMHLAGGEGNVGLGDFARYCGERCYSYLQPDPVQSGSLTVVRKIAGMAEAFGIPFGPHHGKSGVGMLASLHMQCAAPNSGYLEYMIDPGFWNPEGFQAGFEAPYPVDKQGFVHAPQGPGLGAPWDRGFFKKHGLTFG